MDIKPVQRRQIPAGLQVLLLPLWWLVCLLMLLSAILGLISVVIGTISLLVEGEFLGMQLGGETVRTTTQKALFTALGAVVAFAGIGFWWLRQRGYVVGALIVYGLLLVLVLAIGWLTGRSDIITVFSDAH